MSTQILYHAFRVRDYRHVSFENEGGELVWTIERTRGRRCTACDSARVHEAGTSSVRDLKTLPVGPTRVVLRVPISRLFCCACRVTRAEDCPLVDGNRHYTRALERYAVMLCRVMTIKAVAQHLGLTWDTVKAMEKGYLARRFDPPPLRDVKRIAIDEIAVRKGHVYKTVVLDLDSGHILHVADGKGADAVRPS